MKTKAKVQKNSTELYRILIIDDDKLVVDSFERVLQEYERNFSLDKTTDAKRALSLIERNSYDLVITDLVMPDIDGIQVLQKVKEIQPDSEVILITAYSSTGSALDAMHFGAFDYITKPFDLIELKMRITRALKKRDAVLEKRRKVEEIERLCYTIAHDFKATLVSIMSFSKILIQEYHNILDKDGAFLLERINANIQSMESMVEGLLEYTKIGKWQINKENINTNEVIEEVVINYTPALKENEIELIIEHPLPEVYFYRNGLTQIFTNLIDNAIKYARRDVHSYIRIGTNNVEQESIHHEHFYIEDNGIGIPKQSLNTIFEIFQRGEKAPHKKGYGIGLAVVKKILETMNCTIFAESEQGKPTRLCFTLPQALASQ
jgi:two-component system sensor histidine kinase/response regulator